MADITPIGSGLSQDAVASLISAAVPLPSTMAPRGEAVTPTPGTDPTKFAQEGHMHPRLTSTTMAVVASGSTVQVAFTRTFANKPGMVMTEIEGDTTATSQPAIFKLQSWVQDANSNYTGAVIKVWRSQVVPQNLATLLLGAVFNLFSASVVGTNFCVIAIARSDV